MELMRLLSQAYGSNYKSSTPMAANTADQVFSAASNVNGADVWFAEFSTGNANAAGGSFAVGYVAKATAPATALDGTPILFPTQNPPVSGSSHSAGVLCRPIFVPAGLGLYYISAIAEVTSIRKVLYTLR